MSNTSDPKHQQIFPSIIISASQVLHDPVRPAANGAVEIWFICNDSCHVGVPVCSCENEYFLFFLRNASISHKSEQRGDSGSRKCSDDPSSISCRPWPRPTRRTLARDKLSRFSFRGHSRHYTDISLLRWLNYSSFTQTAKVSASHVRFSCKSGTEHDVVYKI